MKSGAQVSFLTVHVAPEVTPAKKFYKKNKPKKQLSRKIMIYIFLAVLVSVGKVTGTEISP